METMKRLILASASPRRRELLGLTGLDFEILTPDADESCTLAPRQAVEEISRRKAGMIAEMHPDAVVLAADTLVAVDDKPLGKPHSKEEAFAMLRSLSDRSHAVYTGVTVAFDGRMITDSNETLVRFGPMTDQDIMTYIATGEPMDKAGAYALQGIASLWIEEIRGSASNVIGLPMLLTRRLLTEAGLDVPAPKQT